MAKSEGREGLSPADGAGVGIRLPGGSTTLYQHGSNPEGLAGVGNVADGTAKGKFSGWNAISASNGFVFTAPVGRFRPNGFGRHDLHGNVLEWCSDWYGEDSYGSASESDPRGPSEDSFRVFRGGSWFDSARVCRSAFRDGHDPSFRNRFLGFRMALSPSGE